jgi:hypothetical protein
VSGIRTLVDAHHKSNLRAHCVHTFRIYQGGVSRVGQIDCGGSDRTTCTLLVCPAQHAHARNTEQFEPQPKKPLVGEIVHYISTLAAPGANRRLKSNRPQDERLRSVGPDARLLGPARGHPLAPVRTKYNPSGQVIRTSWSAAGRLAGADE